MIKCPKWHRRDREDVGECICGGELEADPFEQARKAQFTLGKVLRVFEGIGRRRVESGEFDVPGDDQNAQIEVGDLHHEIRALLKSMKA